MDKLRFNQIFYNLLSNAAKYTQEGGRVEFYSEKIPQKNNKTGMRFHVKDNGFGMSSEYQNILFDPFTQEKRSQHSEQRGTGLGLAIVKKIVDLVGGEIKVSSQINKGTDFIVDLYAFNDNRIKKEPESYNYDSLKLQGIHILLVDDTEINTIIIRNILEYKGCYVDIALNGLDAVNTFKSSIEGYYDIIITDVRMPVMDGLEEARQIRNLNRKDAKSIPIIAATADAYSDILDKILASGMNARIVKPIRPEILCETIVNLLI